VKSAEIEKENEAKKADLKKFDNFKPWFVSGFAFVYNADPDPHKKNVDPNIYRN
jgi:hypothetical protein